MNCRFVAHLLPIAVGSAVSAAAAAAAVPIVVIIRRDFPQVSVQHGIFTFFAVYTVVTCIALDQSAQLNKLVILLCV
jgi:hypothetical protein